jgi:hypothetical protein
VAKDNRMIEPSTLTHQVKNKVCYENSKQNPNRVCVVGQLVLAGNSYPAHCH